MLSNVYIIIITVVAIVVTGLYIRGNYYKGQYDKAKGFEEAYGRLTVEIQARDAKIAELEGAASKTDEGITHAKGDQCSDAPVADDIDKLLRSGSDQPKRANPRKRSPSVDGRNEPRPSALRAKGKNSGGSVRGGQGRSKKGVKVKA